MARKILLNYRRADSKGYAVAIYNSLVSNFGEDQIFMDIDAIEPGTDFVKVLEKAVQQCDVLIVLIGSLWSGIKDASGERRLDNEGDFVRIEIKAALEREVTVLPVLVEGAKMPTASELPDDIRSLARRQAFVISDRFSTDVEQLVKVLNKILERARRERLESLKADLKAVAVEKTEKKKPAEPHKEIPKPTSLVRKQPERVLEKTPVKSEVKPKAAEKARKRAPVKPIPKTTRRIAYALTAATILVISYILVKDTDIFTSAGSSSISTEEQPIPEATEIPAAIEIPREYQYPVRGGLSSVGDETMAINASNVDRIIELVRWDDGVIHELAYSPVEDLIAVAASNYIHIMKVDQTNGNHELNEIRAIHFDVPLTFEDVRRNLSISPDGSMLAAGHEDGRVRLWQVSNGKLLHTLGDPVGGVAPLAFSPDGSTLAFQSTDNIMHLWRVSDGKLVGKLGDYEGLPYIDSTAFSPDGTTLASGHQDGVVRLWGVPNGELLDILGESSDDDSGSVSSVAFSPDGSILASGYDDGNVKLWQISNGNLLEILHAQSDERWGWISSVTFSPDGSMLAAGNENNTARIWRTSDWKVLKDLEDYASVLSVSFSPDGNLFATSSMGVALRLYRVLDWEEVTSRSWNSAGIHSIALSPDKSVIASASYDGIVRLWQVSDGELLYTMGKPDYSSGAIAFSPDGNTLAFLSGRLMQLHQVSDGKQVGVIRTNWDIRSAAFSPDGSMLATGYDGTRVRLWQVPNGMPLNDFGTRTFDDSDEANTVAFSPDGSILASGDGEGTVRLWQVSDGELLHTLEGHSDGVLVLSVAFSPDGSMLASGDTLGQVRLWRVSDGVLIHKVEKISEDQNSVNNLSFSPDGEVLSGCGKYVWLWGVSEGNFLKRLGTGESSISCMALSSDGTLLVTGSSDSTIQIWGVVK